MNEQKSLQEVFRYVLKAAPIYWSSKEVPWTSIQVPKFPLVLSIISGITISIPALIQALPENKPLETSDLIIASLIAIISGSLVWIFLNYGMMVYWKIIIKHFRKQDNNFNKAKFASQRVVYFSTFYQVVLFFSFLFLGLIDIFTQKHEMVAKFIPIIFLAGFIRLLAVYQAVKRETNGSTTSAFLALIPCIDVWGVFLYLLI